MTLKYLQILFFHELDCFDVDVGVDDWKLNGSVWKLLSLFIFSRRNISFIISKYFRLGIMLYEYLILATGLLFCHSTVLVTLLLANQFADRWIGRISPHHHTSRSPDITPLELFLWGSLKLMESWVPIMNFVIRYCTGKILCNYCSQETRQSINI